MLKTKSRAEEKQYPKTSPVTPQIYSYIRFSTPEQAMGDSERRQLEAAEKYADEKEMPLDEILLDKGLSAFKGEHKKKGALGRFLIRVKNSEVPKNSILLIENIDRLGREPMLDAFETVTSLIKNGVNIQTLRPREFYDIKSVNSYLIYQLIGQMQRAYEESKRKSYLISQARERARRGAREAGKKITARCPAWLEIKEKGKKEDNKNKRKYEIEREFIPIPEAVESIEMIFDLKLKGIGVKQIAKRLNAETLWKPPKGNGWRASYIQKILQNPAVIGKYQPYKRSSETGKREPVGEPILKYYPQVISENTFYAVQERFKENKGKGGRTGKARNLFTHLVKCPYCGGSMAFVDKGKPPKGRKMLICDNGRRGFKCAPHSIQYDECEELILSICGKLRVEEILASPDEQSKHCQLLHNKIQGHIGKLQDIEKRIDNYVNQIGDEPNTTVGKLLKDKIREYQEQAKGIEAGQEEDEKELKKAKSSLQSFDKWKKGFATLRKAIKKDENAELRMRLRLHLRELIEKIEIFSVGLKENSRPDERITFSILTPFFYKDNAIIPDKKTWATLKKEYADFCNYASKRVRGSKEGRFLHIYLKSGSVLMMTPKGSVLYNSNLTIDEEGYIDWGPSRNMKRLWKEYKNNNKCVETVASCRVLSM